MRTFATESGKRMIRRLAIVLCLSLIIGLIPNALLSAPVTASAASESFYAAMDQNSVGKKLYFTGEMSGYYLATSENVEDAAVMYKETVSGGFKLYFLNGSTKNYINLTERDGGKANVEISTSTGAVFSVDAELGIMVSEVAGNLFWLGTYGTYQTFSASKISYINAGNKGTSQFPMYLEAIGGNQGGNDETEATEATTATTPAADLELITAPQAETAYKMGLVQGNLDGKTLYFNGTMDGNFLATTEDASQAVDIKLEAANGGYYLYFMNGSTKTYINYNEYEKNNGKFGCRLSLTTEAPAVALTYDSNWNTMVIAQAEDSYTLGTYGTYNTMSASSVYYITGDKASEIGVTQFLMRFYAEPVEEEPTTATEATTATQATEATTATQATEATTATQATEATTATQATEPKTEIVVVKNPEAGASYMGGLVQKTLGKTLYFAGVMDGNFLATTEDASKAVELKMEAVTGGYYLYFMVDGAKNYINYEAYTKNNGQMGCSLSITTTAPAVAMTYNSDWNTFVVSFEGNDFVLGTYGTYNTISASSTYYITGDKAADIDVTQFLLHMYAEQVVDGGNSGTGDNSMIITASVVMIMTLAAVVVLFQKRKFF